MATQPWIITLKIDDGAQAYFNRLRKQHFPAGRNYINAHLTIFHKLPPDESIITNDIDKTAAQTAPFDMQVAGVVSIGNGVAYKIESEVLKRLHKALQSGWKQWLTQQDMQGLWPHITVQNKVEPDEALRLKEMLLGEFEPFTVKALGFKVWKYLGGPWGG
jgi:2'-5' RNA ligase